MISNKRRKIELVCISDVHLGTFGCKAKELNRYLKSIDPEILILNGDIIDIWQFSKNYWPNSHMKILQRVLKMMGNGTKVYYLTGNHDEMLRKFTDFKIDNFELCNKLVLELDHQKAWFFHGDVFDITMKHSKWLAKLGAIGYDTLILLNAFVNWISVKIGREKLSISKQIKQGFKQALKFIADFEQTAIDIALEKDYNFVVCGHIHQPQIRKVEKEGKKVTYLNSGDWIENLSALEYHENNWKLVHYHELFETDHEWTDEVDAAVDLNQFTNIQMLYQTIIK
jgi:UDP-2,3-diacylglucosamine pyrophosphatase LpxH